MHSRASPLPQRYLTLILAVDTDLELPLPVPRDTERAVPAFSQFDLTKNRHFGVFTGAGLGRASNMPEVALMDHDRRGLCGSWLACDSITAQQAETRAPVWRASPLPPWQVSD